MEVSELSVVPIDAVLLLDNLASTDKPVHLSLVETHHNGGEMEVELYVQHEEKHVPDVRILLNSDGTWAMVLKLVPEA